MSESDRFATRLVFSIVGGSTITSLLSWLFALRGNLVVFLLALSVGAIYIYLQTIEAKEKNKHVRREFEKRRRGK